MSQTAEHAPCGPTREVLANRGLSCTRQRAALYDALCATDTHPTAEELFQMVQDCAPSPSLATVYSALETFCRVGLARKLPTTEGSSRYDAATRDHVHVRFAESGAVEDVPRELSESVLESVPRAVLDEIEQRLGVRITGVDIQLTARRQPAT